MSEIWYFDLMKNVKKPRNHLDLFKTGNPSSSINLKPTLFMTQILLIKYIYLTKICKIKMLKCRRCVHFVYLHAIHAAYLNRLLNRMISRWSTLMANGNYIPSPFALSQWHC